ncbi:MAG: hypothetical protein ACOX2R_06110 [Anaerolineae bacterium]|jgi:uncharacterized membrane protein YesL
MIGKAFKVTWQALKDTWGDLFLLAVVNFLWFLIGFSGLFIASVARVMAPILLSVITFPVATAAMYPIAYSVARGKTFHISDFWDGIKTYWWRGIIWFLANILAGVLWWVNLNFYTQLIQSAWVILIGGFWTSLFGLWLMTQLHFWPMLIVQEEPKIVRAWRNSAILAMRYPIYTILVGLIGLLLIVLCSVLVAPLFLFLMALIAILFSNATLTLLVEAGTIEGDYRPDYTR